MEHIYRQIGWGMWLANEDYFIGHPDRLESMHILYSEKANNFGGLGIDDVGIFEFEGKINQEEISFTKLYRRETIDTKAIKGKINYKGKRYGKSAPAGYVGEWEGGKKSGLFTFMAGNIEKPKAFSSLDLTQVIMLGITGRKLEKLDGRFKNHLKEMPFAP